MVHLLELERRAYEGPYITSKDFSKKLYLRAKELVKEYGIVRDPKDIIPTDYHIADAVFKAAIDLAVDVGYYCVETSRIVKFDEEEIKEGLKSVKSEVCFGSGEEKVVIRRREVGDKRPPIKWLGPWGAQISSPELFLLIHQSYAQERIDALQDGVIAKVKGKNVVYGGPSEIMAAAMGARMLREACRRVGRPNMPISFDCQGSSNVAFPAIFTHEGIRPTDYATIFDIMPEMTFTMIDVNKLALAKEFGIHHPGLGVIHNPYGGPGGGSETLAIVSTADALLPLILDNIWGVAIGTLSISTIPKYEDLHWFEVCAHLALKRNTNALIGGWPWVYSEPCTEMVVYELIYMTIPIAIHVDFLTAACAAQGKQFDYVTGMEARIVSDIVDAIVGKSLKDANEWAKIICEKYLKGKSPQKGKTFQECYNLKDLTPCKEYVDIYEKAKKECKDLGLDIE